MKKRLLDLTYILRGEGPGTRARARLFRDVGGFEKPPTILNQGAERVVPGGQVRGPIPP